MRTRRSAVTLAVLLLPAAARADMHKIDASLAASYANQSTLLGLRASVVYNPGYRKPKNQQESHDPYRWGLVVEAASHFLGDEDSEATVMTGGRYTFAVERGHSDKNAGKRTAFVQALAGFTRRNAGSGSEARTDAALAFAFGGDYLPAGSRAGLRAQLEMVVPLEGVKGAYPRASLGFVYRWPADSK
jgi:hypothetical protein